MSDRVFCALPMELEGVERGGYRRWAPGHVVSWAVDQPVQGFSRADFEAICQTAWELWEAVCGVRTRKAAGGERPNVLISTQRIDGPLGVLAQAELPDVDQTSGTLGCWFDSGDSWSLAKNPTGGRVDVLRVAGHEFFHNLGGGHAPAGSRNLMAPTISDIREPQPGWDIPQAITRYDKVGSPDPPDDPGDGDPLLECLREFLGGFSRTERLRIARHLSEVSRDVLRVWGASDER